MNVVARTRVRKPIPYKITAQESYSKQSKCLANSNALIFQNTSHQALKAPHEKNACRRYSLLFPYCTLNTAFFTLQALWEITPALCGSSGKKTQIPPLVFASLESLTAPKE